MNIVFIMLDLFFGVVMYRFAFFSCFYILLFCNLSGCATLSKDQCTVGDWRTIGKTDGQSGRPLKYFAKHKSACLDHKIKVNKAQYIQGRVEGLKSYCKIQHQVDLGIKGIHYSPVCSGKVALLLKDANQLGYQIYTIKNDIQNSLDQISEVRSQMKAKNIKADERDRLEDEERRLQDQVQRLTNEVKRFKSEGPEILRRKARTLFKNS